MPVSKEGSKQYDIGNRSVGSDVAAHADVREFSKSGLLQYRARDSERPEGVSGSFLTKVLPSDASGVSAAKRPGSALRQNAYQVSHAINTCHVMPSTPVDYSSFLPLQHPRGYS